jgi:hypothetical protein
MIRQRRETEGLIKDERNPKLTALYVVFSAVLFSIAILGLIGIVVFSCVHWTSFS